MKGKEKFYDVIEKSFKQLCERKEMLHCFSKIQQTKRYPNGKRFNKQKSFV